MSTQNTVKAKSHTHTHTCDAAFCLEFAVASLMLHFASAARISFAGKLKNNTNNNKNKHNNNNNKVCTISDNLLPIIADVGSCCFCCYFRIVAEKPCRKSPLSVTKCPHARVTSLYAVCVYVCRLIVIVHPFVPLVVR